MPLYGGGEVERGRPRLRASIHPAHEGGADDPPDQGPRLNGGGDAQPSTLTMALEAAQLVSRRPSAGRKPGEATQIGSAPLERREGTSRSPR